TDHSWLPSDRRPIRTWRASARIGDWSAGVPRPVVWLRATSRRAVQTGVRPSRHAERIRGDRSSPIRLPAESEDRDEAIQTGRPHTRRTVSDGVRPDVIGEYHRISKPAASPAI